MRPEGLATAVVIVALTAGCSALPRNSAQEPPAYVNIARTNELRVQLVPQASDSALPNEQPAAFKPAQLEVLLASLRVRTGDGGQSTLASPTRLKQLAADMSKGFVRAGPRQDVAFSVFRRTGGSILSTSRRITSGRAFYRDNTLNIIFGEFDAGFSEFRDLSISPLKNGSRANAQDVDMAMLVASPSWQAHDDRADWIELPATPEAIESAASLAPQVIESSSSSGATPLRYGPAASATGAAAAQGAALQTAPSAPVEPAASSPSAPPAGERDVDAEKTDAAPAASAAQAVPAANNSGWERIEDRLSQLKRLRDKNLISAQDYQNKKEALLRELP